MERECQTLADLIDLMRDNNVVPILRDTTIAFTFPDDDSFLPTETLDPLPMVGDGTFNYDRDGTNFKRTCRNTIRSLVSNPQFWRLTTTADQITRFWHVNPQYNIQRITKRKSEPLTMHFDSIVNAKYFYNTIG